MTSQTVDRRGPERLYPADTLVSRFKSLACRSDSDLQDEVLQLLHCELDLPADERRRRAARRLRAWLSLLPDERRRIASAFERALQTLEPEARSLIEDAEKTALLDSLSYADFRGLAESVPYVRRWWPELPLTPARNWAPASLAMALLLAEAT